MNVIQPCWQVPANIRAFSTLRTGGVSRAPYDSFNLGAHVGDEESAVKSNRTLLLAQLQLPHFPHFLNQTHSTQVIELHQENSCFEADAVYSNQSNQVCLVMTADCLPVLLTNQQGDEVAAVHAGWRGLCAGILENTVAKFRCPHNEIIAWLGPAISQPHFQVGEEVLQQFIAQDPKAAQAFIADPQKCGKFLADLYQLARLRLNRLNISQVFGGEYCTFAQSDKFFSYRRDKQTGRMATLIWFE